MKGGTSIISKFQVTSSFLERRIELKFNNLKFWRSFLKKKIIWVLSWKAKAFVLRHCNISTVTGFKERGESHKWNYRGIFQHLDWRLQGEAMNEDLNLEEQHLGSNSSPFSTAKVALSLSSIKWGNTYFPVLLSQVVKIICGNICERSSWV